MIFTVTEKNNIMLEKINEIENIIEKLHQLKNISDDDEEELTTKLKILKSGIIKVESDEESFYVNIEYDTKVYSYRLVIKAETTINEIRQAIRIIKQKIKNSGIPVYKEYVDYILEETCKKNKWKIEKLSESPITEKL